ncbi:MAG: hypothetical protein LUE86_01550 [Clostridiales bacterium]|nr:hypothetical protein [Clostridiales bacterium]
MIESGKKVMWLIAATLLTIHAFLFDRIYDEGSSVLSQYAAREEGVGILWCVLALFVASFYCLYEKKYRKKIHEYSGVH